MSFAAPGAKVCLHQAFRCCPFAGAVTSQLHDYLVANGFSVVADPAAADVHVVNSCGSDAAQGELTWRALRAVAAERPDAAVVVTGCLVSIDPKRLAAELAPFSRHASFDPRHLDGLDAHFAPHVPLADVPAALHNAYAGSDFSEGWFHIVASTGCLGACGFCAIRRATGRPRSRPVSTVLDDLRRGLDEGAHDVLLVSTDLSAWGTDLGSNVVELVAAATALPGEFKLAGESFEPTLFLEHFEALLPHFVSGRWAFLGLPIQSGAPRVLRDMARTYDPDAVVDAVRRLKAAAPELVVRTDILFGYGAESDAEFQASIEVSRAFDLPSFNAYQPRPGTPPLVLPPEVLRERRRLGLAELQARAQAGLPSIRRWGGQADRPQLDTRRPERANEAGDTRGPEPWHDDAGRAWLLDTARRFKGVLARHSGWALGNGWAVAAVEVAVDAVVLRLAGPEGRQVRLGLRRPEWPGEVMASGPRFAVFVLEPLAADEGLDRAIKRLLGELQVTTPPSTASPGNGPRRPGGR